MRVWALTQGCTFGGTPIPQVKDVEEYASIREAVEEFRKSGEALSEPWAASCRIWFVKPYDEEEDGPESLFDAPYPDRLVEIGPHGGVKVTRC